MMELEEMKQMWQQYDKKLQENNMLTEKIITHLVKDRSGNEIAKMLNWEYITLAVYSLLVVVYIAMGKTTASDRGVMLCYALSLLFIVMGVFYTLYKIRRFGKMDFGVQSITATKEELERFRILMARERVWGLILLPFLLLAIYVVVNYWVHGVSILDHFEAYSLRIIIAVVAAVVGSLYIYRKLYFDTIAKLKQNIQEIREFTS
jgi:hypothetical protein